MSDFDEAAVKDFFDESFEYWEKLFHIAFSMLNNRDEAEDAVQDVLIKAAKKHKQFEGRSQLYTWLVRILINHCHDIHRKHKRQKTSSMFKQSKDGQDYGVDLEDGRQDLQKKIELSEASLRLIEMTEKLDTIYKEVVLLRYFEEMSYAQIAEVLNISEGTVKSRLNNARRILKSELSSLGIGEEYLAT